MRPAKPLRATRALRAAALGFALVSLVGCRDRSPPPKTHLQLLGTWRAPSGKATLTFISNETLGISVEGREVDHTTWYAWRRVGSDRVEIKPAARPIRQSEDLPGGPIYKFMVTEDQLTLIGQDGASLTYTRVPS